MDAFMHEFLPSTPSPKWIQLALFEAPQESNNTVPTPNKKERAKIYVQKTKAPNKAITRIKASASPQNKNIVLIQKNNNNFALQIEQIIHQLKEIQQELINLKQTLCHR